MNIEAFYDAKKEAEKVRYHTVAEGVNKGTENIADLAEQQGIRYFHDAWDNNLHTECERIFGGDSNKYFDAKDEERENYNCKLLNGTEFDRIEEFTENVDVKQHENGKKILFIRPTKSGAGMDLISYAPDSIIGNNSVFGYDCKIGDNSILGNNVKSQSEVISIGADCKIGDNFVIMGIKKEEVSDKFDDSGVYTKSIIGKGTTIGKNAVIGNRSLIEDNVSIGDGSYIGNNALVRDNVKLGRECTVGTNSTIGDYFKTDKKATLGVGAKIGKYSKIGKGCRAVDPSTVNVYSWYALGVGIKNGEISNTSERFFSVGGIQNKDKIRQSTIQVKNIFGGWKTKKLRSDAKPESYLNILSDKLSKGTSYVNSMLFGSEKDSQFYSISKNRKQLQKQEKYIDFARVEACIDETNNEELSPKNIDDTLFALRPSDEILAKQRKYSEGFIDYMKTDWECVCESLGRSLKSFKKKVLDF